MLAELRKTIACLERPPGLEEAGMQPLHIPEVDNVLGGGIACGCLHEITALSEAHVAAATGFVLGILFGLKRKSVVWIAEDMGLAESGAPCGAGLDEFGLHPERLLTVAVKHPRDLLWTMEEALRCHAVGAVIGEIRHETIDAVALRRLSLAAQEHGALALLLRATPSDDTSTAATRWIVGAALSQPRYGPGTPRFEAQLVRNRRGPTGSWMLEWIERDECFVLASTYPQPLATSPVNRSAGALAQSVA